MKTWHLAIIMILLVLVSGLVVPETNALKVKPERGNLMTNKDGTFAGELVYDGDIGKKNSSQPVVIKVFDRNETMIQSYSVPVSVLDINNGTFRYRIHLSGVYPYDTYMLEFSYGNQTVLKQFPYAYKTNENLKLDIFYITPLWQLRKGITPNDIVCDVGLKLVIPIDGNSAACVKPDTVQKLIERGWAKPVLESLKRHQTFCQRLNSDLKF